MELSFSATIVFVVVVGVIVAVSSGVEASKRYRMSSNPPAATYAPLSDIDTEDTSSSVRYLHK